MGNMCTGIQARKDIQYNNETTSNSFINNIRDSNNPINNQSVPPPNTNANYTPNLNVTTPQYLSTSENYELKKEKEKIKDLSENLNMQKTQINEIIDKNDNLEKENQKLKETDPIQEQINKMKLENQKLKLSIQKRNKLISDLKDKCNEQHAMIKTINSKIENIKKFIPDKTIRDKENEKFEEQLAIAAVNEQIMKELCGGGSDMVGMTKIFEGDDKNKDINKKIEKIPQIYYKDNKYENPECTICFDIFKENELLKQLKCNHIFHKECLSQWLLNNSKCPICNKIC